MKFSGNLGTATSPCAEFLILGGHHGLGESQGTLVAALKHHGCRLLRRGHRGGSGAHHGKLEIFYSDQCSQFASLGFTQILKDASVKISMDGKGRWVDNVFIERLWCNLKYECVYLPALETGSQAGTGIRGWIDCYNTSRLH